MQTEWPRYFQRYFQYFIFRVCWLAATLIFCWESVYVVAQFYPWFKFYFPLFQTHYHTLPYPETKKNKTKDKIKPASTCQENSKK